MKVMFIPSRAVPFNPDRVQGGLEAVHLNVLKYLVSIGADIDYIGFDNDTYEARVKRAEAVWKKYNRDAVVAMWDKIFTV